jgi:hypothetical protein
MVSIRRLRAVLVFALVSGLAWAIVGTFIFAGVRLLNGDIPTVQDLWGPARYSALFGVSAGTTWAVVLGLLPRKEGGSVSPLQASLVGMAGGMLVFVGWMAGMMSVSAVAGELLGLAVMGMIGAAVGVSIQRIAARGELAASSKPPLIRG